MPSIWRDIKTWGDYAYVSSESSGGVFIVDMSPLPDGEITSTSFFTGSLYPFSDAHNIYIDENGRLYIFGANSGSGGAIICDLNEDPMNPVELGRFNDYYFHDGMVRDNILYGSAIYQGFFAVVDVSDPANTEVLATASTPGFFTHNSWASDDGNYVFTTDEVNGGYVAAYDISDLDNITELDRVQSNPGSDVIPHNTHFMNDFIITSYYKDGVVVHDVSKPDDIIEVANFDTSPSFSGGGYAGCWGVYPFLPSGNIIASDIEEGLYILSVEYKHASRVEGAVVDSLSGEPLAEVDWNVVGLDFSGQTDNTGTFDFGTLEEGNYSVLFSKEGYTSKSVDVVLENGVVETVNVELSYPAITGIDEPDNTGFSIYPNPFVSTATIEYNFDTPQSEGTTVQVLNTTGMVVEEQLFNGKGTKISIGSGLPSGIYFIKINIGAEVSDIVKVVKK